MKRATFETPYLLVVNGTDEECEKEVLKLVHSHTKRYNLKQKTVTPGNMELTVEVRMKEKESSFVNQIAKVGGVKNAVLISYNGDYVS